ncbi:DinB superfamily protein [Cnuella takakiae]|uniref:DinB superfamily protein n=1 Tax=Cnuella takakiae TaxID=1302690 RepID=A0A1M4X7H7_9BACT|nr:DinB family protein [Cnuella takakiae]OLY91509.1 hypothetical protein BUE76_06035 [Cnuella takakiae]SHE89401.1 DinB superfamily protein [Cnuella takakiae]
MKKFKAEDLINSLQQDVRQLILGAEHFRGIDPVKLNYPPAEGSWTVLQALEHLNLYNRYYLPEIERKVAIIPKEWNAWFVPGMLGDYFTRMMQPANVLEVKNKMKTPKGYRPELVLNADAVLQEFITHQHKLLKLLEIARKRNMNEIKIATSLSKLLKLKLGDTFRFLIAHEQRHMVQARNALKALGLPTGQFPVVVAPAGV